MDSLSAGDPTQSSPQAAQEDSWTWDSLLESIPQRNGNATSALPPSSLSLWTHRDTISSLENASYSPIWEGSNQELQDLFDEQCKEWYEHTSAETCPEPSFQSMQSVITDRYKHWASLQHSKSPEELVDAFFQLLSKISYPHLILLPSTTQGWRWTSVSPSSEKALLVPAGDVSSLAWQSCQTVITSNAWASAQPGHVQSALIDLFTWCFVTPNSGPSPAATALRIWVQSHNWDLLSHLLSRFAGTLSDAEIAHRLRESQEVAQP